MLVTDNLTIEVPQDVHAILKTLRMNGFEAYIVGGCVRDAILAKEPKDWDITTSALPEQVKSLFSNTADTGIQHGTVMVIRHGTGYEVTTYRVDGEYKDGRHPESVSFTRSLEEDLKRRDFTINALAYSPEDGVVDLFDGVKDLNDRKIRCVRDPDERFNEDALRIMRAVRFSAQLDFEIDTASLNAIRRHVTRLSKVSMERIREEFEKTLMSEKPERIRAFADLGMADYIIPEKELAKKCFAPEKESVFSMFPADEEDAKVLRLSVFFSNLNAEEAKRALRLMKYDNKTIGLVSGIIDQIDDPLPKERSDVKRAFKKRGKELFLLALSLREAFARTGGDPEFLKQAEEIRKLTKEIEEADEAFCTAQLAVNGSDLIREGFPAGKEIGVLLDALTEFVIDHPQQNEKETLLKKTHQLS